MTLETEAVLDRRRMKRATSVWRATALAAGAVALGALAVAGGRGGGFSGGPHQIARVTIEGLITEDRPQLRMLERIAEDSQVDGVIVVVNTPGGTTTGGEALYEALRKISAAKPIVSQFGTVAASAGYIVGLGTDYIVARGNTITGSVGVIMQWPEVSELLAKVGVKMNEVKSGPLKASPSMYAPMDDASRTLVESMIHEGQQWFLGLVRSRRGVDTAAIPGLEAGRIFSGREALSYKMVDELGGETEVLHWLQDKRMLKRGLKIVDWKPKAERSWALTSLLGQALADGLSQMARETVSAMADRAGLASIGLDGLVSVWQPAKN